jgi:hypothetical protein
MPLAILAYHSHHIVGPGYAANDHVAFERDLDLLTDAGWRIVPLAHLVRAHHEGAPEPLVALTFDDGPVYDVEDVVHPEFGRQTSFANAKVPSALQLDPPLLLGDEVPLPELLLLVLPLLELVLEPSVSSLLLHAPVPASTKPLKATTLFRANRRATRIPITSRIRLQ